MMQEISGYYNHIIYATIIIINKKLSKKELKLLLAMIEYKIFNEEGIINALSFNDRSEKYLKELESIRYLIKKSKKTVMQELNSHQSEIVRQLICSALNNNKRVIETKEKHFKYIKESKQMKTIRQEFKILNNLSAFYK